ncbi:PREDICTED: pentatricopeptide repeat-containing protein At1g20230-like [Tarenaya hassleriana]|uniref:pentatricopeptide repeat-containing protein At1g20230-like n=1 Tax=Tarenaya hassleriana TaxID=28532 RepID=UPI0008FD27AE|nr:PREDICTED: pentatricopeptide repeat-containing protein At1g20230-like [Tarenaya hassleriana]
MTKKVRHLFEKIPQPVLGFLESPLSSSSASLSKTRQVHAQIIKLGAQDDGFFATKIIASYSNHHCFADAELVLRTIPEPTIYAFSSLIYAFTRSNRFSESLRVFSRMISHGLSPDSYVLPNLFKACAGLSGLEFGKQIHCIACVSGLDLDPFVQGSLFHMYLKCDRIGNAREVFDRISTKDVVTCSALLCAYARKGHLEEVMGLLSVMEELGLEPNLVSWNGILSGFNHSGYHGEAGKMFQKMHSDGVWPDEMTVSSVLPAVGDLEKLDLGRQIHGYVIKQGLMKDKCVTSAMVDMYGKCGCGYKILKLFDEFELKETGVCNACITGLSRNGLVDKALEMFELFKEHKLELNVVSWTSIIAGCAQNGKDIEALELFREMQVAGVKPNSVTIPSMLPACGNRAALIHGRTAHGFALRSGITHDVHVGSALIDMYSKCGRIDMARMIFDTMSMKNLVCWNSMMGGYAMHGESYEVIIIFQSLRKTGLRPDFISFTNVLAACSHGGLTDEGLKYFNMMSDEYGIKPRFEHYAFMVNLFGRAGKLQEVYEIIKGLPFETDARVWEAVLSSCRVHNYVDLSKIMAENLIKLETEENPSTLLKECGHK